MTAEVIAFFVLVAVFVGILLVAFSASRYRDPYQGSYPPYPPPYAPYPYPPYPPQPPVNSLTAILTLVAIIFALYVALQYVKNTRSFEQENPPIIDIEKDILPPVDSTGGDIPPIHVDTFQPPPVDYDDTPVPSFVTVALYCQEAAFANIHAAYEAAQQLARRYPGQVFIGEKSDDLYPFKLLVGPYSSVQALKDAHGEGYIRAPADEGIDLYDPNR